MARIRVWLVLLLVTLPTSALAHVYQFAAVLSGASQSPATPSPAVGTAVVKVDVDINSLTVKTSFSGLLGNITGVTIHTGTDDPLEGFAMAATPVPALPEFPLGGTSGDYVKTIDLELPESYNPNFLAANGNDVGQARNTLYVGLLGDTEMLGHVHVPPVYVGGPIYVGGRAYLNIATTAYPDGEIRGFLVGVPGDFNHDLVTNAADYTVWRNTLNDVGEGLDADTDHTNIVDYADYGFWRQHYGLTVADLFPGGSGSGQLIPEPSSIVLAGILAAVMILPRRRRV